MERFWKTLAALLAFVVIAAACGSSVDDAVDAAGEAVDEVEDAAGDAVDDATDAVDEAMAEDGEVGSISADNIVTGPSGMTIDLNECPDDWANDTGITDTEITLGHSFPFSGTLATYGGISDGMVAYLEAVSEENPEWFGGRSVKMVVLDDAYEPARSVSNSQQLVEDDKIFAFASMAGTPSNLAVYDYLNDQCVPHLFPATGHPAWADPENHPWTVGSYLAYTTEGSLMGKWIDDKITEGELPAGSKVAVLQLNNDFGKAYSDGLAEYIEANSPDFEVVKTELFEGSAPNLTNEFTTIAAEDADALIVVAAGTSCTQAITEEAQSQWDPAVKIMSSTCQTLTLWTAAENSVNEGWVTASDRKDIVDPAFDDDEFTIRAREIFDNAGVDYKANANAGFGLVFAPPIVEALRLANEAPGGINRTNLMVAAWSMDFEHPWLRGGARWHTDGPNDGFPVESAQFLQYLPDEQRFDTVSDLIELDGTTPLCAWDGVACQ